MGGAIDEPRLTNRAANRTQPGLSSFRHPLSRVGALLLAMKTAKPSSRLHSFAAPLAAPRPCALALQGTAEVAHFLEMSLAANVRLRGWAGALDAPPDCLQL